MDIEPVDAAPARAFPRASLRQRWTDLTFVHWAVAPELVQVMRPWMAELIGELAASQSATTLSRMSSNTMRAAKFG